MQNVSSPSMNIVRKEEKETRLVAFLAGQMPLLADVPAAERRLSVLARGCDSPVLRALAVHAHALTEAGVTLRVMIIQKDLEASDEVAAFLEMAECRLGCDARLLDAHEQLALGHKVAWIGDCMRREPMKRDAFECYSAACETTASMTHRSFDRIWPFASRPSAQHVDAGEAPVSTSPAADLVAAVLNEAETTSSTSVVSTRH